jgi:hypothetical protein
MIKPLSIQEFDSIPKEKGYFSDFVIQAVNYHLTEKAKDGTNTPFEIIVEDVVVTTLSVLGRKFRRDITFPTGNVDWQLILKRGINIDKIIEVFTDFGWIVNYYNVGNYPYLTFDRKQNV